MTTIIIAVLAACAAGYIVYRKLRPRLESAAQMDECTRQENERIQQQNEQLEAKSQELQRQIHEARSEYEKLIDRRTAVQDSISVLNHNLQETQATAKTMAEDFYQTHFQHAQEQLERALKEEGEAYQESIQEFLEEYNKIVQTNLEQREDLRKDIARLTAIQTALVEEAKRREEMEDNLNFYRIQLSAADLEEIAKLRSVEPYLRDPEPLNKVIWKVYYEKPTKAMIGRVVGAGTHTGIYKITDIASGKCYIGQAVKLADEKLCLATAKGLLL